MNLTTNELINLKYMMKVLSITTWLILFILAGCSDASPSAEEPSAQERTITLNLDITTRADELPPDGSVPGIIRLWIFDNNNEKLITYVVSSQNVWTPVGTDGIDIKTTLQTEIEAENIDVKQSFKIYLLLNQPYTDDGKGSTVPVDFSDIKTLDELKGKMFVLTEYKGDNKVPMTGGGTAKFSSVEGNKIIFDASINATRCVAKLGIYCTKSSKTARLILHKVTLNSIPDKGSLFKTETLTGLEYSDGKDLLSPSDETIETAYTEISLPDDTDDFWDESIEEQFTKIPTSDDENLYVLENLDGGDKLQINGSVDEDNHRYRLILEYTLNDVEYVQTIYLSKICRNQFSKIYIRIKSPIETDISYVVQPWDKHTIEVPTFD